MKINIEINIQINIEINNEINTKPKPAHRVGHLSSSFFLQVFAKSIGLLPGETRTFCQGPFVKEKQPR